MGNRFDIKTSTNQDFARTLVFTNGGVAIDFTGWTGLGLKFRDAPGGTTRLALSATASVAGSSITFIAPSTAGLINLIIKSADLGDLPVGFPYIGSYDLVMTDNESIVRRMLWGSFISYPGDTI